MDEYMKAQIEANKKKRNKEQMRLYKTTDRKKIAEINKKDKKDKKPFKEALLKREKANVRGTKIY